MPSGLDQAQIAESLRRCLLFVELDDDALNRVGGHLLRRRFRRDEVVFHQGDPGDSLHVLASGSRKVTLPSLDGEEAIIASLRPGDFFGELALLDGAPRSATVVALEPSETMVLSRPAFRALIEADAPVRDALLAGLSRELRRLTGQVEELHFLDLAGRLASRLARLAREVNPTSNEVTLGWRYTQSDVAAMIGATRQSVNKLLADLVADGLITIERDTLVVHDVEGLERQAER
jgi:CRP-like cAMP-binding protein